MKWKNEWLKILTYTEILREKSKKNELKTIESRSWFNNCWSEHIFALKSINWIIFEVNFQKAEEKQISFKAAAKFRF